MAIGTFTSTIAITSSQVRAKAAVTARRNIVDRIDRFSPPPLDHRRRLGSREWSRAGR